MRTRTRVGSYPPHVPSSRQQCHHRPLAHMRVGSVLSSRTTVRIRPAGLEHHDRRPARQRNVLSLSLHARPRVGPYGVCHVLAFRARRALPLLHVRPLRDALRSAGWRADAGEYAQQWIGVMPCALHAAHARSRHAKRASEQAEEGYYGVPRLGPPMAAACRAPVPPRWTWLAPHVVSCRPGSFPS